ncbi:MAG: hypothetical protein ABSF67_00900 [Roseiarcus sp.]|jgi:hypothetical protein
MSRNELRRARGLVGVAAVAAALALSAASPAPAPSIGDRYDGYVNDLRNQKFSFGGGGDAEVKEAMVEWAKSLVSNLPISEAKKGAAKLNIGESIVDAVEFWDDVDASIKKGARGPTKEDVSLFMAKMVLHNVAHAAPEDFDKVAEKLGLSEGQAHALVDVSVDFAEGGAQAAGSAAEKETIEAIKKIELTAIDAFCPPCEIGRKAVLLGVAESQVLYATVQEDRANSAYEQWKQTGDADIAGRGFGVTMAEIRAILTKKNAEMGFDPPTDDGIKAFVKSSFTDFAADEKERNADADLLALAKADYLKLSDTERAHFGKNDDDRIDHFSEDYLRYYKMMIAYQGARPFPPGGEATVRAAVVEIVKNAGSISILDLRQRIAADLIRWGWLKPTTAGPIEIARVRDRLATLDYFKMKALFDYMDIALPKDFYACMCAQSGHTTGSGVGYNPDGCPNTGCQFTGNLGGQYCVPMPTDAGAFAACAPKAAIAGGKPLDQYIAEELAKGKR